MTYNSVTADMAGHTVIGFENWYIGSTFAVLNSSLLNSAYSNSGKITTNIFTWNGQRDVQWHTYLPILIKLLQRQTHI